jgi:peptide/nickel transport system substrate-binding protein
MKNTKMLVCILTAILLVTTVFAILPALAAGPDFNAALLNVGTIGTIKNVDPTQAYDTASGELIMNVYDSVLEFGTESKDISVVNAALPSGILPVPANYSINVGTDVAELGETTDIPGVCYLPSITVYANGSSLWTFQVNTNLVFQPWYTPSGTLVIDQNVTWQDVVYLYQRTFVQDSHNSPEWMLMGPFFGVANFDAYELDGGPSLGANESMIAGWIQRAVSGYTNATGQYVQFYFQYAPTGMWDILCQTWSCIPPMQFCIDHGCWDGTWTAGWSGKYRRYPSDLFTPLDEPTAYSLYHLGSSSASTLPNGAPSEPCMCGTGPYCFTFFNPATLQWRIDEFAKGEGLEPATGVGCVSHPWPGPYDVNGANPSEAAPTTVIMTGIDTWATRKMEFLAGDLDICAVEPANMFDLLASPSTPYTPIPGITVYYDIPTLETDADFFTLDVSASSLYIPLVNGAKDPGMFDNVLVREAFCQALNSTAYISGAFYGEAIQPNTFWAVGLTPLTAYLNSSVLPAWEINIANVVADLTAAGINSFSITLVYNAGNVQRMVACEELAATFAQISVTYSKSYVCTVASEEWPAFLADCAEGNLPVFCIGWLADFSDADDFAVPYMATWGAFTEWQHFSNSTIDALITAEESLSPYPSPSPQYSQRVADFEQLQIDYIQNAISLPLDQPLARHWCRTYVYGYYYNQLYPGGYYWDDYKSAPSTTQNVTLDMTGTLNGIVTYKTVYVWEEGMAMGGGAPAPVALGGTGSFTPMVYYVEVKRTDATGGLLYVTLGLFREPGESGAAKAYGNGTYLLVASGEIVNATFDWYEDGVIETITANNTGVTYTVGADSYPITFSSVSPIEPNDTAPALESITNGTFVAKTLTGDLLGTGTVDIFSALVLSAAFGATPSSPNWNPLADILNHGVVDIFDAIALAANFGLTVTTA